MLSEFWSHKTIITYGRIVGAVVVVVVVVAAGRAIQVVDRWWEGETNKKTDFTFQTGVPAPVLVASGERSEQALTFPVTG